MLKQLFIFLFAFIATSAMAQSVIPMYADQFIYKSRSGKTAVTFNIATDNVKGFMFNTGNGAVEFRRGCIKLSETQYLIGVDTLTIPQQSSGNISGTAGGDLYGTYPSPTVDWSHGLSSYDQYYLKSTDAASTYASKTSLGSYLLSSTAAGTYATQASLNTSLLTKLNFVTVSTYAAMIALGTPTVTTRYKVANDENKGMANTIYEWWSDGARMWIAANQDN